MESPSYQNIKDKQGAVEAGQGIDSIDRVAEMYGRNLNKDTDVAAIKAGLDFNEGWRMSIAQIMDIERMR